MTREARCTCGALRTVCRAAPARVSVCHCNACKRRTGSTFGVQARYAVADVELVGEASEYVRVGDAGARITFRFCPTCGDTQSWTIEGMPAWVVVPAGAFGDKDYPGPDASVYEARQPGWVHIDGLVDRWD